MGIQIFDKKLKAAYAGMQKIKMAMYQGKKIWSAGSTVTYMVDTNVSYTEEVDSDASCLSPKTFTPSKAGWSFVGWREDRTASASVLGSKVMADSPVTLYAVFRAGVTVTYYNNSTSASSTSGYRYYNNGSVVNPSFQLTQTSSSGWTARGWSTSNQGNAGITYANGAAFTRDSNVTLYGLYQQSITVTYYNNSTSASRTTGTRYWAPAGYINPSFTLTQAGLSGWTARGWSTGTAGNSGITYNNGAAFTRDSNTTLYGMYQQTITLSYNGNGASGGSTAAQSGTRYYNSNGATVNPSFTLRANGFARTNYSFAAWALGSAGGTQYKTGTSVTLTANTTFYAYWMPTAGTAFGYTGGIQTFTAPVSGTYQLTAYGAQGGNSPGRVDGGYGGYATGRVSLIKGQVLYIVVGGMPSDGAAVGGYNGGGNLNSKNSNGGPGGGATHIARRTGVLSELSSYKSDILIVAGGGGGSCWSYNTSQQGGAGGGTSGGATGTISGSLNVIASYGANQARGGYVVAVNGSGVHPESQQGTFGQGGSGNAGGGGGYYGGGSGLIYHNPGTGGSGYIGGVSGGAMQNGVRTGNGHAIITFVG